MSCKFDGVTEKQTKLPGRSLISLKHASHDLVSTIDHLLKNGRMDNAIAPFLSSTMHAACFLDCFGMLDSSYDRWEGEKQSYGDSFSLTTNGVFR
jgi:hypothetical protein